MRAGIRTNIHRSMCVQTHEMGRASVSVPRLRLRCKGNLVQWAPEYPQRAHRKCRKTQLSFVRTRGQGSGARGQGSGLIGGLCGVLLAG